MSSRRGPASALTRSRWGSSSSPCCPLYCRCWLAWTSISCARRDREGAARPRSGQVGHPWLDGWSRSCCALGRRPVRHRGGALPRPRVARLDHPAVLDRPVGLGRRAQQSGDPPGPVLRGAAPEAIGRSRPPPPRRTAAGCARSDREDAGRRRNLLPRSPPLEHRRRAAPASHAEHHRHLRPGEVRGRAVKLADAPKKLGRVFDPDRWMGGQPPPSPPDGGPLPTRVALLEHEQDDRQRVLGVDSVEIPCYLLGLSEIAATYGLDEGGVGGRGHRTHVRICDAVALRAALGADAGPPLGNALS